MLKYVANLSCIVAVSVILSCIGYGANTWQWWAIIVLMTLYKFTALIDEQ